jgi:hypothetical protein
MNKTEVTQAILIGENFNNVIKYIKNNSGKCETDNIIPFLDTSKLNDIQLKRYLDIKKANTSYLIIKTV